MTDWWWNSMLSWLIDTATNATNISCNEVCLSFKTRMSTHVEHLLDVELVVDAVSEDVLVLPYEGDVGVGQIHPRFLRERRHSQSEDDSNTGGGWIWRQTPHIRSLVLKTWTWPVLMVHVSLHRQQWSVSSPAGFCDHSEMEQKIMKRRKQKQRSIAGWRLANASISSVQCFQYFSSDVLYPLRFTSHVEFHESSRKCWRTVATV